MTVGPVRAQTEIIEKYNQAIAAPTAQKIALLQEVLASAPNFLEARYALGATYYEQENFKASVVHFEYILDHPEEVEKKPTIKNIVSSSNLPQLVAAAYNAIGSQYLEDTNADSAITVLTKAIALDDSKPIFHYNLGIAYLKKGLYRQSLESLRASLKKDRDNALAWFNLGTAYWYLEDYDNAVDSYNKGLAIDPNNESGRQNLQKALDKIRVRTLYASADSAIAASNPSFAIARLKQIKRIDPTENTADAKLQDAEIFENYLQAKSYYDRGRWVDAQKALNKLPAGYRDSNALSASVQQKLSAEQNQRLLEQEFALAKALFSRGDYAGARQKTNGLLRNHPQHAGLRAFSTSIDSALSAGETLRAQQNKEIEQNSQPPQITIDQPKQQTEPQLEESTAPALSKPAETDSFAANEPAVDFTDKASNREQAGMQSPVSSKVLWVIIVSAGVLLFAFILIARRKRSSLEKSAGSTQSDSTSEQDHHGDESVFVKAAVEKVDFNELEKEKAASSDSSHQRFFEDLVDDHLISSDPLSESGTVEIREIADAKSGQERPEPEDKEQDESSQTGTEQDDADGDTFLSIIQAEQLAENKPERVRSTDDTGSVDATHTVDMSQFKTRKIGRYIIEKEIGRGAAGRIYKAWDPKLDRTVVIKTVSYSLTASDDEIRRLKARVYREARAAAKLNHPNIVVVYDVEDEPTFSYIVMEHIEGMDLRELLLKETKISPERTINILIQVCKALQFSHGAGIIHRDIKPSNILIVKKDKVKVTDFGIAKVSNHLTLTQTGRVVGTPSYMAPEQIEGADVDGRADIFSLGVVLYELLTGQRPFVGESLAALAYKIVHVEPTPPSLVNLDLNDVSDEMVSRAIAKDPADRYQTINDFLKDLQRAQTQLASSK